MMRILELVVRFEPNLRAGVRWVRILELAVRFGGGVIGVWPDVTSSKVFAPFQFNVIVRVRILEVGVRGSGS